MEKFCFEKAGKFVGRGGTRSCEARFQCPHPTPPGTPLCYALGCVNLSAQPDASNTAAYRHLPIHYPIPQRRTATCPERETCPLPKCPPWKGKALRQERPSDARHCTISGTIFSLFLSIIQLLVYYKEHTSNLLTLNPESVILWSS